MIPVNRVPRVGIVFRPQLPPERLPGFVASAEKAGLDDLWLWEDCFLEGGLTSNLMAKDLMLYLDLARELKVTSLNGPACLANFHLAAALGYGEQISNRVVDALGDIAGGVRVSDGGENPG